MLEEGGTPALRELRLHNGTIYRWNRPVYDVTPEGPHLRVENRLLAAGPTVADTIANAAFYFGLVRALATDERPLWSQMSFSAAEENFYVAARHGISAQVYWPGLGQVSASELVLRRLLPLADQGLAESGVEQAERDRFLGMIEQRCLKRTNGAEWFVTQVRERGERNRQDALRSTLPGVRRAHAQQRAGAHLVLSPGTRALPAGAPAGAGACAVSAGAVSASVVPLRWGGGATRAG